MIKVIHDVAEQTNLPALNATIEASIVAIQTDVQRAVSEIVDGVTTVAGTAESTAQGFTETQNAADSLDSLAGELEQQVAASAAVTA